MRYYLKKGNEFILYNELPRAWKSGLNKPPFNKTTNKKGAYKYYTIKFREEAAEVHRREGFYPYKIPQGFDSHIHEYGGLFIDGDFVTERLVDLTLDLAELKAQKIGELYAEMRRVQSSARSWREMREHFMQPITQSYKDKVTEIYTKVNNIESNIESQTDAKVLAVYSIPIDQFETLIEHFEGLR